MTVMFFSSTHCSGCRIAEKDIPDIVKSGIELRTFKVDEDEGRKIASKFSVMALPTALLMNSDTVMKQFSGSTCLKKVIEYSKEKSA